jgi:APA family basic amino acid/polyamine antiporter
VGLTALTMLGVKVGATFQNLCMLAKLLALAAMTLVGLVFFVPTGELPPPPPPASGSLARGCVDALLPVLFTCGGWQMLSYIAPQIRDPQRSLPRSIVIGVLGVVAIYLLINWAYLRVLGLGGFAGHGGFASSMAERTLGAVGSRLLLAALVVSSVGICTVNIIATPWMYVAMAREGLFFERFANLHPKSGAPLLALALQMCVALAYWLWGRAEVLVDAVVFVEWIFHALVAWALLSVRWGRPELPRPFKSPLWPVAPLIYVLVALWVVLSNLYQGVVAGKSDTILIGCAVVAVGVAVYRPWRWLVARASGA